MEQENCGEGELMRRNFLIYHDDVDDVFLLWELSLSAARGFTLLAVVGELLLLLLLFI